VSDPRFVSLAVGLGCSVALDELGALWIRPGGDVFETRRWTRSLYPSGVSGFVSATITPSGVVCAVDTSGHVWARSPVVGPDRDDTRRRYRNLGGDLSWTPWMRIQDERDDAAEGELLPRRDVGRAGE